MSPAVVMVIFCGAAAAWLGAVGSTWHVDDATCPATGSGTVADPFCRIQDAICLAGASDTVLVAPGIYLEAVRMKPDVSLISSGGPAVTTINAAGKPCTDNDYCTKRTGTQCSTVTFASGHTLSTVLDGFTITGGAGLIQSTKVAGGGIFVFSSPRIVNNVITNNILSGPAPQRRTLRGAGVYVAVGAPIISNNTITGNRAIPLAGTSSAVTYGYGGGLWISFFSAPVVTSNVIQGNQAGDPNLAYSIGSGGGIVVWPGSGAAGALVDGNLIGDNRSDSQGGGISLLSLVGTTAASVVTNNIIVGNDSKFGGGVYTYFNRSSTINNTITDNFAFVGGGVYTGQGDPNLPVRITNNIITGNRLRQFGTGGGIYTLDFSATFEPAIRHNDLWGNDRNQCAGERTNATCIGVDGNFAGDPLFTNTVSRNFTLDPNSPAIDRAEAAVAPLIDIAGVTRGYDGDGVPDSPAMGDVDVGAHEFAPGCIVTGAEVCDGQDNDCNGLTDDGLGQTTCGVGTCQVTVQNCTGGVPQTCTPSAPGSEVCDGLDNDCNGLTDDGLGQTTCGVGTCRVTVQNCSGGVPQTCTPSAPGSEVCDGLDNDCNGVVDNGFPDSDLDGLADCVDPDDDGDSVEDTSDCAPLDPTAFFLPVEVADLDVLDGVPTPIVFATQVAGSGTTYQTFSGSLAGLLADRAFGGVACVLTSAQGGYVIDGDPSPPVDDGWFYLSRAVNACGMGTLGSPARDLVGQGQPCQTSPAGPGRKPRVPFDVPGNR